MKRTIIRLSIILTAAGIACAAVLVPRSAWYTDKKALQEIDRAIADYTDKTVIKTLEKVVDSLRQLDTDAAALTKNADDAAVQKIADSWRTAKAQWQQTSVFAYGPASFYDYDKQIATWPTDKVMVEHHLRQIEAGELELDSRILREKINSSRRGLYTAEYLIFRNGNPRKAMELTPAEVTYLQAVTGALVEEGLDYLAIWKGTDKLDVAQARKLKDAGFEPHSSYGEEFTSAGTEKSRYFSTSVPLQEMFTEAVAVVEDLCPVIAEELGSNDPMDSMSMHSRNAQADALNLLKGVENAYFGGLEGDRGVSLSALLAERNPILDRRIKIGLADVRHRINQLGDPYAAGADELYVRRAVASCEKLAAKMNNSVPVVCMDPLTKPWIAYGR